MFKESCCSDDVALIFWSPAKVVFTWQILAGPGNRQMEWYKVGLFETLTVSPMRSVVPHYDDVIMTMLASQITSLPVVCSIVYSDVNQKKHQSSASLAFVREIHRGPVNFPHKWPVTRKMFPFDDVIMEAGIKDRDKKLHPTVSVVCNYL